jgi:iron complex outermembrane receptor protein
MTTRFVRASLILLGCSTALSPPVHAADTSGRAGVEEVVVTARRREESLQTTPVAVTAITADTLEKRNVVNISDIAEMTPGLQVAQTAGTLGTATVFIRGIGYTDSEIGQDSPIGLYLDGVPSGRVSTALMQLVSPDRVEVLRGPQGTLFGRNTTGGAISITTHTSRDEFNGMVKASYGRFNQKTVTARIDSGLLGHSGVKFTAAYQHREQDGIVQSGNQPGYLNPGAERSDTYFFKANGDWDKLTAAMSLDHSKMSGTFPELQMVDATPAMRNLLALSSSAYGGCTYTITTGPLYNVPCDANAGEQHMESSGASLTLTYHLSDAVSLKSISAWRGYKRDPDPAAYGPLIMANVGTAAAPRIASFRGVFDIYARSQSAHQVSEEAQVLATVGDFDGVAGFFYFTESGKGYGAFRLPFPIGTGATAADIITPRYYTIDSKSVAGYGQVNYRPSFLDKKLEVSGGIRWTKDTRTAIQTFPLVRTGTPNSKNTSFLVSATYNWTDDLMTYVRYSTGYRAGGYNPRAVAGANPLFFPERLKSLEGGFKLEFFDKRVRFNGAAYHNKYRDLQVAQFVVPGTSTGAAGGVNQVNANATFNGVELELAAVPVERLTVTAAFGYIDPKYTRFPSAPLAGGALSPGCTAITNGSGAVVAQDCAAIAAFSHFPKTSADFSVNYALPAESYGEWSAQLSFSYKSRIVWGAFNLPATPFRDVIASPGYGLLNGRIALSHIPISKEVQGQLAVVGENLTDKAYRGPGIDFGSSAVTSWGKRRSFMLEGTVEF